MPATWEFVDRAVPAELRERVLEAAIDELTRWGIERFSVGAMAARHDIDEMSVYKYWGSNQRLLLDVVTFKSDEIIVVPNTGSLRSDLESVALSVAAYLNTSVGRRLVRALVRDHRIQQPDETRQIYWKRRHETIRTVLDQAAVRGELRDGVDPLAAVQILIAPLNILGLYTDEPIPDKYCTSLADLAWRALVRH